MKKVVAILSVSGMLLFTGVLMLSSPPSTKEQREIDVLSVKPPEVKEVVVDKNLRIKKRKVEVIKPLESEVLYLSGEVGGDQTSELVERIKEASEVNSVTYLIIDSPGGSVLEGNMVISAIETAKNPVYTVCYRICASMAAVIHQYGHRRLIVNRATLMFHNASGGFQGEVGKVKSRIDWIDRITKKTDAYIANRSHHDLSKFLSDLNNEIFLDGEEALEENYADGMVNIILPKRAPTITFFGS
jgi:ATP-dependent Clp endopeptidase proteolytic subunit ClpP